MNGFGMLSASTICGRRRTAHLRAACLAFGALPLFSPGLMAQAHRLSPGSPATASTALVLRQSDLPGKKLLAITDPKPAVQASINSFSETLVNALRASAGNNSEFDVIDQAKVREAIARGGSRDGAARILKPDVMVSPAYVTSGSAIDVVVMVWDLRSSSSYGIRVTSARLEPEHPENYLGPLVQSVMKQLADLANAQTGFRRR